MAEKVKLDRRPRALEAEVGRALRALLPGSHVAGERAGPNVTWDLSVMLGSGQATRRLLVECKSVGEPRYLAQAITIVSLAARQIPRSYPVVAAPYIGPEGQRLCREAGVGYLDLSGNAFLRFDGVLIDRRTSDRPPRARARLRRLFSPRSSRILRVMLEHREREWTLTRLAGEAGVSVRTAHLVVNALEEKAFLEKHRGAIALRKPGELLDLWADNYRVDQHQRHTYYTLIRNPREVGTLLATYARREQLPLALTLHSGAALVAPFVRSPDVHAYVGGDPGRLAAALDFRSVDSGGNVHLLIANDEGVFYGTRKIDRVPVVCNTQLYLDLVHYPARGREQAEALRRQTLGY